jgi:3-phosphoshikimate 1-carboxyvinyltransferase
MRAMGGDIEYSDRDVTAGDESATITARPSRLRDGVVAEEMVPSMIDELPLLACVAAAAGVKVEVRGAAELRVKESDRIAIVVSNLQSIGADAEELPDGFRINAGSPRLAGRVRTAGDHRIAMSFGMIGALHGNAIEVDDPECVAVSYPRFWTDLESLRV